MALEARSHLVRLSSMANETKGKSPYKMEVRSTISLSNVSPRIFPSTSTCAPPKCAACELASARRRSMGPINTQRVKEVTTCANNLILGERVSVDKYESSVRGRLPNTKGKEAFGNRFSGGTIFNDHASGCINCVHQESL